MQTESSHPIRIFYSWQSDLPATTNRNLIRSALRTAASQWEQDSKSKHARIDIDEATRNVAGSPNIPATVFDKIKACDIFICDVTTINADETSNRKVPNPNVTVELGYAVAELGWNRIILLFNRAFGKISDAPFDFDRHRLSPYDYPYKQTKTEKDKAKKHLDEMLLEAIGLIIEQNPLRPREITLRPSEIKHNQDERTMIALLGELHIPTIDEFIGRAPHVIPASIIYFWTGFHALLTSHLFHIHDAKLRKHVLDLHKAWKKALSHDSEYHLSAGGLAYIFSNEMDLPLPPERQKVWDSIAASVEMVDTSLKQMLAHVRKHFISIDISQLSKKAWADYAKLKSSNSFLE